MLRGFTSVCVVVVVVWLRLGLHAPVALFGRPQSPDAAGGTFGAVDALFSGLAFAGLINALYLQKVELALQREDRAQTRAELARTADSQQMTQELVGRQVEVARAAALATAAAQVFEFYAGRVHRLERSFTEQEKSNLQQMRRRRDEALADLETAYDALRATPPPFSAAAGPNAVSEGQ